LMISAPYFASYPGYSGNLSVSGTVQIRAADVGSTTQTLEWSLDGIDADCTSGAGDDVANGCGIHVHEGTSCANLRPPRDVGGHYYSSDLSADLWADVVYVASANSSYSSGSTTVVTGLTLSEMEGKVFVVHDTGGTRIACGILSSSSLTTGLSTLAAYPGYSGDYSSVSGTVTIRAATDDSALQTLDWDLEGIDPSCTSGAGDDVANGCGIHVHEGTSCAVADDVGGHYYSSDLSADPWADVVYVASGTTSSGSTTAMTGLKLSELIGRAFVVHELTSGTRIACGILQSAPTMMSVSSGISYYPDYEGDLNVTGVVTLTGDMTQTLKWDLAGLDTACVSGAGNSVTNGCGIHVHEGLSCDFAADVGGHYYSSDLNDDPWSDAVYVSDGSGMSSSSTTVITGLLLWELAGRAFVIHELTSGARIACGVLVAGEMASVVNFASYPGYTGNLSVAGTVNIASSGVVSQVLTWDLTGVDTDCTAGAGDDVANGCGIHVHAGSTCDVAADVGGHFYSSSLGSDPWADIAYVADNSGASMGAAEVVTGTTLADQVGKAFVVHELTGGGRVACSIVDEMATTTMEMATSSSAGMATTTMGVATATTGEGGGDDDREFIASSVQPTALWQLVLPGVSGLSLLLA